MYLFSSRGYNFTKITWLHFISMKLTHQNCLYLQLLSSLNFNCTHVSSPKCFISNIFSCMFNTQVPLFATLSQFSVTGYVEYFTKLAKFPQVSKATFPYIEKILYTGKYTGILRLAYDCTRHLKPGLLLEAIFPWLTEFPQHLFYFIQSEEEKKKILQTLIRESCVHAQIVK